MMRIHPILLAVAMALSLAGCQSSPPFTAKETDVWTTLQQNIPHAATLRVTLFRAGETPSIVLFGFNGHTVTVTVFEATTRRLMAQSTQYVKISGDTAIPLQKAGPGSYLVEVAVNGAVKETCLFSVR